MVQAVWRPTETTVSIVYKHVAAQSDRSVIVYTTGAICNIAHNHCERGSEPNGANINIKVVYHIQELGIRTVQ